MLNRVSLVHRAGPLRALRESWSLTRNAAGAIFGFQFVMVFTQYLVLIPAALLYLLVSTAIEHSEIPTPSLRSGLLAGLSFLIFLLTYAALHAPEIVYFYGLRAGRALLTLEEAGDAHWLVRARRLSSEEQREQSWPTP